ncbi:hypothetical protein [Romeriopsis navalis]|uniref:hypothetical protein n=1 Tax=Romeriopsis navalis TaxID=2992132 RepID=UPI0021F8B62B|nr:hypothetical protein [Romeriopsis navalis]
MYAPVIQDPMTFEKFLAWDDGKGRNFELRDGVPMPIVDPNAKHEDVADELCALSIVEFALCFKASKAGDDG